MNRFPLLLVLLLASWALPASSAEQLLMTRSRHNAEVAMEILQASIREYGYQVAHVQKCDGGMQEFGYKTDYYRVVFFGKVEEVRRISERNPELIPFLPLKILLFAEQEETVLTALNPIVLGGQIEDPEVDAQLQRWYNDIRAILGEVQQGA